MGVGGYVCLRFLGCVSWLVAGRTPVGFDTLGLINAPPMQQPQLPHRWPKRGNT